MANAHPGSRIHNRIRREMFLPPSIVLFEDEFYEAGYSQDAALANESDPSGKFSTTANRSAWLVTLIDGDTDAGETIVIADDAHGGVLAVTNNDKDNDVVSMQLNGEGFALAANREIWYSTRIKFGDVSAVDWAFGLAVSDTDILGGVADSIMFRCPDATGDIDYVVEKDSTETTADSTKNVADDTFVVCQFHVVNTSRVEFYIDNAFIKSVTTNIPDNEAMSPFFEFRNSGAAANVMSIDYVRVAADR